MSAESIGSPSGISQSKLPNSGDGPTPVESGTGAAAQKALGHLTNSVNASRAFLGRAGKFGTDRVNSATSIIPSTALNPENLTKVIDASRNFLRGVGDFGTKSVNNVTPSIPVINGSSVNPNSSILIDSSNSSGDSRASSPKGSPALNLASLPYATREDMQNLDGKHWELHRRLDAHAELHDEFATKKYVTALVSENNAVFNGRLENHEKSLGEFVVKEDLEKFKLEASNLIIQGRSRSYSNDIRMLTSEIQRLNSEIENLRTKPVQSTDVSDV